MTINSAFQIITKATTFHRSSRYQKGGTSDQQYGSVSNQSINASTLHVYETGTWIHLKLEAFNETTWTLLNDNLTISRAPTPLNNNEPLFCFSDDSIHSQPFICGHDTYKALLQVKHNHVVLDVIISGPKKSGRIITEYH